MTSRLTGGCACGAVRYDSTGEIEFSFKCYCRKCQRATGSGHAAAFAVAKDATTWTGELKHHTGQSDSGAATLAGFCPTCGSPMTSATERMPERIYILAATLDDPSVFKPTFAVHEDSAQPWDPVDPVLRDAG